MKRFISIFSVILCLALMLTCVGCATDGAQLDTDRNTVGLSEYSSYINGQGVLADISSNDASNTSTVIVYVQSDNGKFPAWVLGAVVNGGAVPVESNGPTQSNVPGAQKGVEALVNKTIVCLEDDIKVGEAYDLYCSMGSISEQINLKNYPGLKDGDKLTVGKYSFVYSAKDDAWRCLGNGTVANTGKYYPTDKWEIVDITSKDLKGKTSIGCQWVNYVTADQSGQTNIAFMTSDLAGIMKSIDGGKSWKYSSLGISAVSSNCIAMDPKNPDKVIATGITSTSTTLNPGYGIYISENCGETWTQVLNVMIRNTIDVRHQFAFDQSSYDATSKECKTIYWSTEWLSDDDDKYPHRMNSLMKSTDGGRNWTKVDTHGTRIWGCDIDMTNDGKVLFALQMRTKDNPTTVAGGGESSGKLYKSTDGGQNWTEVTNFPGDIDKVRSFDIVTATGNIFVLGTSNLYKSTDNGATWTDLGKHGSEYKNKCGFLAVSADETYITYQDGSEDRYSLDGGKTWGKGDYATLRTSNFAPLNIRASQRQFITKAGSKTVIAVAGDIVMRSDDGGKTWVASSKGYAVPCTDKVEFNVNNQKLVYMPNQDYGGQASVDGGATWVQNNLTNYGGFSYGGYMLTDKIGVTVMNAESNRVNPKAERTIVRTENCWTTYKKMVSLDVNADYESMGALNNDNIVHVGNMRSTDQGNTWTKMTGCVVDKDGAKVSTTVLGVWCIDYNTGRLYGRDSGKYLVYSDDNGANWKQFYLIGAETLTSLSCDKDGRIYFSTYGVESGGRQQAHYFLLEKGIEQGPVTAINNPCGYGHGNGVLTADFYYPGVVYFGADRCNDPVEYKQPAAMRSLDFGKTWTVLDKMADGTGNTVTENQFRFDVDNIVVNYGGDEVWFVTYCSGVFRIPRVDGK